MPKTTEQKFTCKVNYEFDITLENLRDLFFKPHNATLMLIILT